MKQNECTVYIYKLYVTPVCVCIVNRCDEAKDHNDIENRL